MTPKFGYFGFLNKKHSALTASHRMKEKFGRSQPTEETAAEAGLLNRIGCFQNVYSPLSMVKDETLQNDMIEL